MGIYVIIHQFNEKKYKHQQMINEQNPLSIHLS